MYVSLFVASKSMLTFEFALLFENSNSYLSPSLVVLNLSRLSAVIVGCDGGFGETGFFFRFMAQLLKLFVCDIISGESLIT